MIYLSSFKLSNQTLKNPNIYPYNIFRDKYIEPFSFAPITIFYGNNGCGKSTLLNIIAGKLKIKGKEMPASNAYYENYVLHLPKYFDINFYKVLTSYYDKETKKTELSVAHYFYFSNINYNQIKDFFCYQ